MLLLSKPFGLALPGNLLVNPDYTVTLLETQHRRHTWLWVNTKPPYRRPFKQGGEVRYLCSQSYTNISKRTQATVSSPTNLRLCFPGPHAHDVQGERSTFYCIFHLNETFLNHPLSIYMNNSDRKGELFICPKGTCSVLAYEFWWPPPLHIPRSEF